MAPTEQDLSEQDHSERETLGKSSEWPQFLDRLVHDLREPLRSIHAFSELLGETAKGRLGEEGEDALREIFSGTARIRTLIDSLAGYSLALRKGDLSIPEQGVSLQLAFELAIDGFSKDILACDASVTGQGLPRVVIGLEPLTQVLENLIGNCLKFRGEASPVISVSALEEDEGVILRVADNGIGLDAVDCDKVFQPFMRVHGRKYPGAGMGLSICRKIIEAYGGWIRMMPGIGGGSVCEFWLPAPRT
jgi:signal transduction histidine kinase